MCRQHKLISEENCIRSKWILIFFYANLTILSSASQDLKQLPSIIRCFQILIFFTLFLSITHKLLIKSYSKCKRITANFNLDCTQLNVTLIYEVLKINMLQFRIGDHYDVRPSRTKQIDNLSDKYNKCTAIFSFPF